MLPARKFGRYGVYRARYCAAGRGVVGGYHPRPQGGALCDAGTRRP